MISLGLLFYLKIAFPNWGTWGFHMNVRVVLLFLLNMSLEFLYRLD